jgi:Protein of unknown function (DUF2793)
MVNQHLFKLLSLSLHKLSKECIVMTDSNSPRHQLPFLAVGQAQKEMTHNEALIRIDALLHMVVEAEISLPPSIGAGMLAGKCWLIGNAPTGEWQGRSGQIAVWTGASWRYVSATDRMRVHNKALGVDTLRVSGTWVSPAAIANPASGVVIDTESRAAIAAILTYLRMTGNIAT